MQQTMKKTKFLSTSKLVKISILSAIGYILMFISVPLPMLFPEFLKIDISDLTALLGGISLGPMAGVTIAFLKNLLQFITGMSNTGGVGEFANFLIGGPSGLKLESETIVEYNPDFESDVRLPDRMSRCMAPMPSPS